MRSLATDHVLATELLAVFATRLEEQRRFRIEQLTQLSCDTVSGASRQRPETPADREIARSLRGDARLALNAIEAAQRRLACGSYGRCASCHIWLPLERLEVSPSVSQCLGCERIDPA
jgi:DnaK suppressor protein